MIEALIQKNDLTALKAMSQQPFWNAWYELTFGQHNDFGIHGACPIEVLHWIMLGMYKYDRESLFNQTGTDSILGKRLNTIATHIGVLLQRQSDRTLPRTSFPTGVMVGQLRGHEMTGMIIVMTAMLRCTAGRKAINNARGQQKSFFPNEYYVRDWIMLLETQLQFEQWLKLPEMEVAAVERAQLKVCELMGMIKRVGKREASSKGKSMGNNLMNFHGTKHVPEDILYFGVPSNVNTFSDETNHKRDKKTAQRMQKRPGTVDIQTATKIIHRTAIDLAVEELNGRPRWHYFDGYDHTPHPCDQTIMRNGAILTGAHTTFFRHPQTNEWVYRVESKMKDKDKFQYDKMTLAVIIETCERLSDHKEEFEVYTELDVFTDGLKQKYRVSPFFEGKPWYDWADIDFSEDDDEDDQYSEYDYVESPCQFRAFIDLTGIPEDLPESEWRIGSGIKAFVERATPNPDITEKDRSDFWEPYMKVESQAKGFEDCNEQFCVSVTDITGTAVLIPDLDNFNTRAYLRLAPMTEWPEMFNDYLNNPHERNFDQEQSRNEPAQTI